MSYLDRGYNEYLEQSIIPQEIEYSDLDIDMLFDSLGGQKIASSGSIESQDRRLSLNLGDNLFAINDGTVDRVKMGKFEDGEYGLRIYDREGNVLMDITGTKNLIQSSDASMQLDLTDKQFRVYEGNILRILMGYGQGLF